MTEEQKNKDFVQLYRNSMSEYRGLIKSNSAAAELLTFFMEYMDRTNALIISNTVLQEVLGYGKATICRAVKYLKEHGYICVLKSGPSNVYIVNPSIAWTSYSNGKEYCRFESTVILSKSEQTDALNYIDNVSKTKSFYKRIDLPDHMIND